MPVGPCWGKVRVRRATPKPSVPTAMQQAVLPSIVGLREHVVSSGMWLFQVACKGHILREFSASVYNTTKPSRPSKQAFSPAAALSANRHNRGWIRMSKVSQSQQRHLSDMSQFTDRPTYLDRLHIARAPMQHVASCCRPHSSAAWPCHKIVGALSEPTSHTHTCTGGPSQYLLCTVMLE